MKATIHWNAREALKLFDAEPVRKGFMRQGKIITAGVSAGIDMALSLGALEWGEKLAQQIQLIIEYDPQPPFNVGSPSKATPAMLENARQFLIGLYSPTQ